MFETNKVVFHTQWEDFDQWDGNTIYDTEEAAKLGAELDYVEYEYFDPDKEAVGALTWDRFGKGFWVLSNDGQSTGVSISMRSVYSLKKDPIAHG